MRRRLILLAVAVSGCGTPEHERVASGSSAVAGTVDSADTYPMVVGLVVKKGSQVARCSGALIAPNLVLTARHCVSPDSGGLVECGSAPLGTPYPPANALVTKLPQMTDLPEDFVAASRIEVAPGGNDTCGYDLAALVLAGEGFGADAAVAVPRIDLAVSTGEEHTAVGYGSTGTGGIGTRRFKTGLHVSCVGTACDPLPAQTTEWIGEDDSFCQADSGAPALDANGKLIGIVSRGASPCAYPILSDAAAWKSWIMELGVSAAADGNYPPPFWATSGVSDPPPTPDAGGPDPQGQPCPCPTGFVCLSSDGTVEHGTCSASCSTDVQCPADMECATFGACVTPAPKASASEDDGGCAIASDGDDSTALVVLSLGMLLLARRRQRAKTTQFGARRAS